MSPQLALTAWFLLVFALLRWDFALQRKTSLALWIPTVWIFIVASRLPSQWMSGQISIAAQALEDGNDLDRNIYLLLICLSFAVLFRRSFEWRRFISSNRFLVALVSFSLLSVAWSDFPFVTFKRWFRDLGTFLVILIALSDTSREQATGLVLRRAFFVLVSLSIVFNKYYPELGREFNPWTGQGFFTGVTTSKNMLGVLSLVAALYFFWDLLVRWRERSFKETRQILLIDATFFALSVLLLVESQSATSNVCMSMGCLIIALAHTKFVQARPGLLTRCILVGLGSYGFFEFGLGVDVMGTIAAAVGRNPDLTGRTHIWSVVLSSDINSILGTGYDSFWLGPRLEWLWPQIGQLNHAHNGYIETYLNLGWIGLTLLICFLIASYRSISQQFRLSPSMGSFALALWTILLFYNVTEAAFKGQLLWVAFLLTTVTVGPLRAQEAPAASRTASARVGAAQVERY